MKLFLNTQFTGLKKDTDIISLGIITENGDTFYAEFTDYDLNKVDNWINENVINKLCNTLYNSHYLSNKFGDSDKGTYVIGNKSYITSALSDWLSQFDEIEFYIDFTAYHWVLFVDLFGNAFNIPKNIYYIPFDICTMLKMKNINPDINREQFIGDYSKVNYRYNSLYGAWLVKSCYEKLINL